MERAAHEERQRRAAGTSGAEPQIARYEIGHERGGTGRTDGKYDKRAVERGGAAAMDGSSPPYYVLDGNGATIRQNNHAS